LLVIMYPLRNEYKIAYSSEKITQLELSFNL
jgi:hypothetical protein